MSLPSLWSTEPAHTAFPKLAGDLEADVVVVGAGIAGMTAALLLQRAGRQVTVIEAQRVGGGETGRSTAHLTELLDARYHRLESRFGRDGARAAAGSVRAALALVETWVRELDLHCGFARVPGYLYAETQVERDALAQELDSLRRVGAEAHWVDAIPLPIEVAGAVRVERQGQMDPLQYLRGLAAAFVAEGGVIFEKTRMLDVDDGEPCRVHTDQGKLVANEVLVMTHVPVSNKFAVHTKVAAYRTYALAARVERELPIGLFSDMQEPYHYIRNQVVGSDAYLIVGGQDHKVGHADARACFAELERYAREKLGPLEIPYRWSGQIIEPADGLPFIGRNPGSEHVYVATGFSGTGITFGTLAGMITKDAVIGAQNPWSELYDATRIRPLAQARAYATENATFPAHLVGDRFARGDVDTVDEVQRGEGCLLREDGKMLAVFRDEQGAVHARSAVCTHLGCYVRWNAAERSWDCPCHGSRFDTDGAVLNGPASVELERPAADSLPEAVPLPQRKHG